MGNLIEMLCQPCRGEKNTSTIISNLCEEHYFEWAQEKAFADLDADEEYFHLI